MSIKVRSAYKNLNYLCIEISTFIRYKCKQYLQAHIRMISKGCAYFGSSHVVESVSWMTHYLAMQFYQINILCLDMEKQTFSQTEIRSQGKSFMFCRLRMRSKGERYHTQIRYKFLNEKVNLICSFTIFLFVKSECLPILTPNKVELHLIPNNGEKSEPAIVSLTVIWLKLRLTATCTIFLQTSLATRASVVTT